MPVDHMLKEAIEAVRLGHKARARDILTRLLRADQSNPVYWLWMSSVVETTREQAYCLQAVLRQDPHNQAARRGLVLIGALASESPVAPQPLARRKWQVALLSEPPQGFKAFWANPTARIIALAVVGVLLITIAFVAVLAINREKPTRVAARPTRTAGPPPTFTSTPTNIASTSVVSRATPTLPATGPTPLWMLLEVTYTPTPVYVNTPHPVTEDFRIAVRAFGRGDWATALRHFRNASQVEPDAPDIHYLIGEAQRMLEEPAAALASYNQALDISPGFAPAFLGRALASLDLNGKAEIGEDLDRAIEYDPNFVEARLQRAGAALRSGDLEAAQEDLEAAEALAPGSPMLAYYQAQAQQLAGDAESALEFARQAYDLDRTYLPAYRLLGEMALANGEFELAQEVLDTYLQYAPEDAEGWMALGQSYMRIRGPEDAYAGLIHSMVKDDLEAAMQAFEHAQELDEELPGVYLYRAVTYLAQEQGQKAVNDLMSARRLDSNSFAINLGLARALLAAGRVDDAISQVNSCERLAADESQLAGVYYWRALAVEANGSGLAAAPDWQALLDLSEDAVPAVWRRAAEQHILALTPTPTATSTPEFTPTPKATRTPLVSKTSSPTPRRTNTLTSTPRLTNTLTSTPRP